MKCASPCAPVEVQVLGQERADDQAAAVVHPAAWRAAGASRRRRPGSRCGPRARRRAAPASSSHSSAVELALVGVARVARVVEQDVGVEVAPRELAHERVGARAAALARALLELARGDAAEVQVGRELGGAAREPVVALVVVLEPASAATRARARAPARSPGANGSRASGSGAAGRRPTARPDGKRSARGAPWTSRRGDLLPGAVEGREDRVRAAVLGAHLADVGDEQPRLPPHLDALRAPPRPGGRAPSRTARRRRRSRARSRPPRARARAAPPPAGPRG